MHRFDEYVTNELGVKYYGRYVDDFVLVYHDKSYLRLLVEKIRVFLKQNLHLTLHPKKIHLQHFSKGLVFLGAYMKPYVKYVERRCKTSFYALVEQINAELKENIPSDEILYLMRSRVNAYLGTLIHFFMLDRELSKVVLKQYY